MRGSCLPLSFDVPNCAIEGGLSPDFEVLRPQLRGTFRNGMINARR